MEAADLIALIKCFVVLETKYIFQYHITIFETDDPRDPDYLTAAISDAFGLNDNINGR